MKGITSTVQEIKTKSKDTNVEYSKYVTSVPNAIIELTGLRKGDKLRWTLENGKLIVEIKKDK